MNENSIHQLEYPVSSDSLSRAIRIIESRTGLAVGSLLRNDFTHIVDRLSGGNLTQWARDLESSPEESHVWQTLIASFTIGETYFMRDTLQFKLLRERILPPLIMSRRQQNNLSMNIWSVGCATGEEPYSIAVTLQEFLPDIDRWKLTIIGTDINANSLEQARRAQFRAWSFRHVSETFTRRYFTLNNDLYTLRTDIQQMVSFVRGNLLNPPSMPHFDVVFCRNILLYFTTPFVEQAEANLYNALNQDGWLILGSAEALRTRRDKWQVHAIPNAPLYQKTHKRSTQPVRAITVTQSKPFQAGNAQGDTGQVFHCDQAVDSIRLGDHDSAERILATILTQDPKNTRAQILIAFVFANRKAYPEAHAHLDTAIKADPTNADAYYLRAVILNEEKVYEQVEPMLRSALYYQRAHLLAILLMGTLHLQNGDIPKAHKLWKKGREIALQLPSEDAISDFSEMNAGQYVSLLNSQLDD